MGASLLAVLMVSILLAAVARRFDVSAPLALVIAGLLASNLPGLHARARQTVAALRSPVGMSASVLRPPRAATVGAPPKQSRQ